MIDSFQLRLLPSPEVLSGFTERVLWGRINDHEVALFIAEMDRRGIHTELGYKNLPQVFVHAVRWDVKVSRQRIKHARLISREVTPTGVELEPELPATASAMAEGALSEDHVDVIAEVMVKEELPAEAEQPLVDYARQHEPRELRAFARALAYRLKQNDPEPRDEEPGPPVNLLVRRWGRQRCKGWFDLDGEFGAKLEAALDPLAKPRPTGPEGPDTRSQAERDGDALAELINLVLRADQLPEHGGETVTMTVTLGYDDLVERTGEAVLDNGVSIPVEQIRKLACEAGVIPLLLGGDSQPLDIGRLTRAYPAGMRRVLVARDRGCAFPGCRRPPKHCEAHHITSWAEGGETSVANSALLCRMHHDLVHRSGWEVKLRHGIPWFLPPAWLDPLRTPRRNELHVAA